MMTFLLLMLCITTLHAGEIYNTYTPMGKANSVQPTKHGVMIESNEATLQATVYSPSIIKVQFTKKGRLADTLSYAAQPGFNPSTAFSAKDAPDAYRIETDSLVMIITKNPIRLRFTNKAGMLLNESLSN
ncbi:MAG: DUF4968 domain-containing protein, partial [Candidatus Kapaibacteriota bacterium]